MVKNKKVLGTVIGIIVILIGFVVYHSYSSNTLNGEWILVSSDSSNEYDGAEKFSQLSVMTITHNNHYVLQNFSDATSKKGNLDIDSKNRSLSISDGQATYSLSDDKDKLVITFTDSDADAFGRAQQFVFVKKDSSDYQRVKSQMKENRTAEQQRESNHKKANKIFNSNDVQGTWKLKSKASDASNYIDNLTISGHKAVLTAHFSENPSNVSEVYDAPKQFTIHRTVRGISYDEGGKVGFVLGEKTFFLEYKDNYLKEMNGDFTLTR